MKKKKGEVREKLIQKRIRVLYSIPYKYHWKMNSESWLRTLEGRENLLMV